jgi:hypothetical protein
MQSGITRRHAIMSGAAAGTLASIRTHTNAATLWRVETCNSIRTVVAVTGFKRLIDNFKKASTGSVTVHLHWCGSLPIAGSNIAGGCRTT